MLAPEAPPRLSAAEAPLGLLPCKYIRHERLDCARSRGGERGGEVASSEKEAGLESIAATAAGDPNGL